MGHWVKGSFEVDKSNVGRLIKFLRLFDDLTNCENVFGWTSSSSETSLFKAAVVVEGWSDALQKDHCKQLSGDGESGYATMVWAYLLVSCVLPKEENDSPSPIIGDGFLDPHNVDYVRQQLNHWVPASLEQFCSDGADVRGSSIFEALDTEFYFTACDWVSVRVRIRCCLVSITLEFGVCCITWLVKQIIDHNLYWHDTSNHLYVGTWRVRYRLPTHKSSRDTIGWQTCSVQ